jgi:hypothetical protein
MTQTPYIYAPIPYFNGRVLKCQGIATTNSLAVCAEKNPGVELIVRPDYCGDRILANDFTLFTSTI